MCPPYFLSPVHLLTCSPFSPQAPPTRFSLCHSRPPLPLHKQPLLSFPRRRRIQGSRQYPATRHAHSVSPFCLAQRRPRLFCHPAVDTPIQFPDPHQRHGRTHRQRARRVTDGTLFPLLSVLRPPHPAGSPQSEKRNFRPTPASPTCRRPQCDKLHSVAARPVRPRAHGRAVPAIFFRPSSLSPKLAPAQAAHVVIPAHELRGVLNSEVSGTFTAPPCSPPRLCPATQRVARAVPVSAPQLLIHSTSR